MYVTDKLVFVELHKTGGTHIGKLLDNVLDGVQVGKHNTLPKELINRFILGSIRNPWDWYVSLWAYGCSGKGGIRDFTTNGIDVLYYLRLSNDMQLKRKFFNILINQGLADYKKSKKEWEDSYSNYRDPKCFQKWLKLILDYDRRFDFGEGYGFSPVSTHSGILTFRYLKYFTSLNSKLYTDNKLNNRANLDSYWSQYAVVNYIVRNEYLEEDLLSGLEAANITLTKEQRKYVLDNKHQKTNMSKRNTTGYYYDQESIDLVAEHESLIINHHNYVAPEPEN